MIADVPFADRDRHDPALDPLTRRTRNALLRAGIVSLSQLASLSEAQLMCLPVIGAGSVEEIAACVRGASRTPGAAEDDGAGGRGAAADGAERYVPYAPRLRRTDAMLRPPQFGPPRMLRTLRVLGVGTPAKLLLVAPEVLEGVPGIRVGDLRRLRAMQGKLGAQCKLGAVVGSADLETLRRLDEVLRRDVGPDRAGVDEEALERAVERLREQVRAGKLHPEIAVTAPNALPVARSLAELIETFDRAPDERAYFAAPVARLAEALRLETVDEELEYLLGRLSERERRIVRARSHPFTQTTLGTLGELDGVTRERIRQIEAHAKARLGSAARHLPLLRTRSALRYARPAAAVGDFAGIELMLRDRGLLRSRSAYDDLLIVWKAIDLEIPYDEGLLDAARDGGTEAQVALAREIHHRVLGLLRNSGAVQLGWLEREERDEELVAALRVLGCVEIAPGWYWRERTTSSVLEDVARKVFAVADRVRPTQFQPALQKHLDRQGYPAPPPGVVAGVLLRLPWIGSEGGALVAASRPRVEDVLAGAERVLYDELLRRAPVATHGELRSAALRAGFSTATVSAVLRWSPIVRRQRPILYALVGAEATQLDLDAAARRNRNAPASLRFRLSPEADADGWFRLEPEGSSTVAVPL